MIQLASSMNSVLNVHGDGTMVWRSTGNNNVVADQEFQRARITIAGIQAAVQTGDIIRKFDFQALGADLPPAGTPSSSFRIVVTDPNPSDTAMGGQFVFATCATGSIVPTDRLTIDHAVRS